MLVTCYLDGRYPATVLYWLLATQAGRGTPAAVWFEGHGKHVPHLAVEVREIALGWLIVPTVMSAIRARPWRVAAG